MLDLAAPTVLLLSIAAIHVAYFHLVRRVLTQQQVQVSAFPAPRSPRAGGAAVVTSDRPLRSQIRDSRPCRRARPMHVGDAVFQQPLICGRGLTITGEALFNEPVKVVGDLVITGRAAFYRPVVVSGDARILGDAIFHQGLLIKSDLVVLGHVAIGSEEQGGWLVARQARVRGGFWLNGELETTHPSDHFKGAA